LCGKPIKLKSGPLGAALSAKQLGRRIQNQLSTTFLKKQQS
jgi:hypothetical protein